MFSEFHFFFSQLLQYHCALIFGCPRFAELAITPNVLLIKNLSITGSY
jgi:hypothetical protein